MRRLCFGGSFNPLHHGHLICSRAAAEAAGFDRVVLIPSAHPPHKPRHADMASPEHRLAMCRLATEADAAFEVSDIELTRSGPSYTIETGRELRRRGWDEVNWLIGADQVRDLPNWREPEALLQEIHFVVMARPGWGFDWASLPPAFQPLRERVVPAPLVPISSTEVRRRVRAGEPIADLTPAPVADYIHRYGLYQHGGG